MPKGERSLAKPQAPKLQMAIPRLVGVYIIALSLCHDIDPNPGPREKCGICQKTFKKERAMWCHKGGLWVHENCTREKNIEAWNREYICGLCEWCTKKTKKPKRCTKTKRRQRRRERRRSRIRNNKEKRIKRKQQRPNADKARIWAWNLQRAPLLFPKRKKIAHAISTLGKEDIDMAMLSEVKAKEDRITWIDTPDITGALIHGNRSAIFLSDKWADEWRHQGSKRWCSERMTCVEVNSIRFISIYNPVLKTHPQEREKLWDDIECQLAGCSSKTKIVIGGDFNASIGGLNRASIENNPLDALGDCRGPFGLGKTNNAGEELTQWLRAHNMCWISSFFNHNRRGTWYNKNHKSWHEIDGFCCRNKDRSRVVTKISTRNDITLTDHRPKQMTIRTRKIQQKPPETPRKIAWEHLNCPISKRRVAKALEGKTNQMRN